MRLISVIVLAVGILSSAGAIVFSVVVLHSRTPLVDAVGISQLVLPVVVAASAVLLVSQILDLRRSVAIGQFGETRNRINELTNQIVSYPELYPLFYDGVELQSVPDEQTRRRARVVAEHWLHVFDAELLRVELFKKQLADTPSLREWMLACFARSPVLRLVLEDNKSFYRPELVNLGASQSATIDE